MRRADIFRAAAVVITGKALERLSEAGVKLRLVDYRQDRSAAEHEVAVIGQLGRREYTDDRAAVRSAYILMLDKRKGNENLSNRQLIAFFADNDLGISVCQIQQLEFVMIMRRVGTVLSSQNKRYAAVLYEHFHIESPFRLMLIL